MCLHAEKSRLRATLIVALTDMLCSELRSDITGKVVRFLQEDGADVEAGEPFVEVGRRERYPLADGNNYYASLERLRVEMRIALFRVRFCIIFAVNVKVRYNQGGTSTRAMREAPVPRASGAVLSPPDASHGDFVA